MSSRKHNNALDVKNNGPRHSEIFALERRGYMLGKKIGQGSYAMVHLANYVDHTNYRRLHLACKIFDKAKAPSDFLHKFFPREIAVLTNISNPYIIQIHSILQRGPRVYMFMRYAENGDLLSHIKKYGETEEGNAKVWLRQIVDGLHYLHSKNIAHRDLKCENILLSRKYTVKIADFGFARYCTDSNGRRVLSSTYCGSAAYAAPEVVSGTPYNPKVADIWSLGVILYIILNASMPFDDSNLKKLLKDQLARKWAIVPKLEPVLSSHAKQLIRQILEPDITKRPSLDRISSSEWLEGIVLPQSQFIPPAPKRVSTHPDAKRSPSPKKPAETGKIASSSWQENNKTPSNKSYKQCNSPKSAGKQSRSNNRGSSPPSRNSRNLPQNNTSKKSNIIKTSSSPRKPSPVKQERPTSRGYKVQ